MPETSAGNNHTSIDHAPTQIHTAHAHVHGFRNCLRRPCGQAPFSLLLHSLHFAACHTDTQHHLGRGAVTCEWAVAVPRGRACRVVSADTSHTCQHARIQISKHVYVQ